MESATSVTCQKPVAPGMPCNSECTLETARTANNSGRKFWTCPFHGFRQWDDRIEHPAAQAADNSSLSSSSAASSGAYAVGVSRRQMGSIGHPLPFRTAWNAANAATAMNPAGIDKVYGQVINIESRITDIQQRIARIEKLLDVIAKNMDSPSAMAT